MVDIGNKINQTTELSVLPSYKSEITNIIPVINAPKSNPQRRGLCEFFLARRKPHKTDGAYSENFPIMPIQAVGSSSLTKIKEKRKRSDREIAKNTRVYMALYFITPIKPCASFSLNCFKFSIKNLVKYF